MNGAAKTDEPTSGAVIDANKTLAEALRLAEFGYKVFPCIPNGKKPLTPNGLLDATTDEFQIELWWTDNPNANLAVSTDGIVVIDRDTDSETGTKNPWLSGEHARYESLSEGPCSQTPRGGDHAWFRQPVGRSYRNTASKLAPRVDTRANGGYVLVYPSVVNGKQYTWNIGNELECSPENLPTPPEWLIDLLDGRTPATVVHTPTTQASEVCEGSRNDYLTRTAGELRRIGFSESEVLASLIQRNSERCTPQLDEAEVRQIAKSVSRYEPDQISTLIVEGCNPEPAKAIPDPGKFPSRLLNVPGFVGDFADFALAGAVREQPEAALAAGISVLGTVTGRKICGATGLRTNVMTLALCETGGGKERPRKAAKDLFFAAGLEKYIPMEDLASAAALVNALANDPVAFLPIDEAGKFIRSTRDVTANPHLAEIPGMLMKFFSQANSTYSGKGYANTEKRRLIINPHVCLFGTSVRQSVLESLTEENLTDGFMSRLLIFESSNDNPKAKRYVSNASPPDSLIEDLKYWDQYKPGTGNLSGLNIPQPRLVDDGPEVNDLFYSADERFRSYQDPNLTGSALWTRAAEKARTLSLIYQLSSDRDSDLVLLDAANWGLDVVEHLTRRLIFLANDWIADNRQGRLTNKLIRAMRSRQDNMPLWAINRLFQKIANPREVADILQQLSLSGTIEPVTQQTKGRTSTMYRLLA